MIPCQMNLHVALNVRMKHEMRETPGKLVELKHTYIIYSSPVLGAHFSINIDYMCLLKNVKYIFSLQHQLMY